MLNQIRAILVVSPLLFLLAFCSTPVPASSVLFDDDQFYCMKEAIYFEAGNQPIVGKIAVAHVILNRVNHKQYPNTICKVVHQGPVSRWHREALNRIVPIRGRCQFSYWCDGKAEKFVRQSVSYKESYEVTELITNGGDMFIFDPTAGATHYHATYVSPHWSKHLKKIVVIQDHIFYK